MYMTASVCLFVCVIQLLDTYVLKRAPSSSFEMLGRGEPLSCHNDSLAFTASTSQWERSGLVTQRSGVRISVVPKITNLVKRKL